MQAISRRRLLQGFRLTAARGGRPPVEAILDMASPKLSPGVFPDLLLQVANDGPGQERPSQRGWTTTCLRS
jgi:hypothetical protein